MIKVYRCSFCDFESQDEKETIEHEKTHVRQIECMKIFSHKKDEILCVMNVVEKHNAEGDFYELIFVWKAVATNKETKRIMSSIFQVRKDAVQEVFGRNNE